MDKFDMALNFSIMLLDVLPEVKFTDIRDSAEKSLDAFSGIDEEKLVKKLQSLYTISTGVSSVLDDNPDHEEWLLDRKSDPETEWPFWDRYRAYLKENEHLPNTTLLGLERDTDKILQRLEDPHRIGPWDTRGMVVGNVQQGKTMNYIGLINKAVDAGYKRIVVLGGHTNALRSQTQIRLDTGFIGYDTQIDRLYKENLTPKIGVGRKTLPSGVKPFAISGTSSADNGDFSKNAMSRFPPVSGKDPLIMAIKKNKFSLDNLKNWFNALDDNKSYPLLLIDDECDYASIDVSPEDEDPSTINKCIRELLVMFDRSAYVAYTATPFANIFIDIDSDNPELGEDLFPRNFIINLPSSDNYVGPEKLFGIKNVEGEDDSEGLPLTREIPLHENWIPPVHNKNFVPGDIPKSLKDAIKSFILATAVRHFRNQIDHNSMLIHVTRFVNVQGLVTERVSDELTSIQQRLRYGDENYPERIMDQFRSIWTKDFEPTSKILNEKKIDIFAEPFVETWDQIKEVIPSIVHRIQVMKFNGSTKDALNYHDRSGNPLNVIAVGGDKLSRGLTLEGLTTCYFSRQSKMYDTLMQMGRWFGYRDGYLDLCRLFSDETILGFFTHITAATHELKRDFEYMEETGRTPMDFRLRVRTHPTTLLISGPRKLRRGTEISMSYSGNLNQTLNFSRAAVQENQKTLDKFIKKQEGLGKGHSDKNGVIVWGNIDGDEVAEFVQSVCTYNKRSRKLHGELIAKYIRTQISYKELTDWTVALVDNSVGNKVLIADHSVGVSKRENLTPGDPDNYIIKALVSSKHEAVDLTKKEIDQALYESIENWEANNRKKTTGSTQSVSRPKFPRGPEIRRTRKSSNGLMLIYPIVSDYKDADNYFVSFALSFPGSTTAREISYMAPDWQVGEQLEFDL